MPNPDGTPTAAELDAKGFGTGTADTDEGTPRPIGVPYYTTDPITGQQVPWTATRTRATTEDDLSYRGGRPGARQFESVTTTSVKPRYFEGYDWEPAGQSPQYIAELQRRLVTAGLIESDDEIRIGVWDTTSRNAFRKVLENANASGRIWEDALDDYGLAESFGEGPRRAPLTVRVTNPDDLRRVFHRAVLDELGQGVGTEEIDRMIAAYQGQETSYQQQAYNIEETGGTVVAPPDPATFAATQARTADPLLAQENDLIKEGGMVDAFRSMLDGWVA